MYVGLGVMWLAIAAMQFGIATTSDSRLATVILFGLAGASAGMSVANFVKEGKRG